MGANMVRVWTWQFQVYINPRLIQFHHMLFSHLTDFQNSHTKFMNALVDDPNRPLYLLVPFPMVPSVYKDLSDPTTQRQIMVDFDNFLTKYDTQ